MSEADEQAVLVRYCDLKGIPFFHIPNERGSRNIVDMGRLKGQGVKPGVPDLMFPVARGGHHGMFVEMKYGRNQPTDSQRRWLDRLTAEGYLCAVCWSADEAISTVDAYMAGEL